MAAAIFAAVAGARHVRGVRRVTAVGAVGVVTRFGRLRSARRGFQAAFCFDFFFRFSRFFGFCFFEHGGSGVLLVVRWLCNFVDSSHLAWFVHRFGLGATTAGADRRGDRDTEGDQEGAVGTDLLELWRHATYPIRA